jgi:RNA polymerase-interacting CarD/CdnL/TRCF family regulator
MAAKKSLRFKVGDWIVHDNYGVGEVVDIMDRDLDGQRDTYFKVSAAEIEYFLPSDKAGADHIKTIRSQKEFDQALEIISEPPSLMSEPSHRNKRVITERWLDGSLPARAALIRDLNGRNHIKELSYDEKRTFEKAENFFINEWIISNPSLTKIKAKQKLNEALNLSIARENLEPRQVA